MEASLIKKRFQNAGYPQRFINSVISQFYDRVQTKENTEEDDYIIPPNVFDLPKPFLLIELPYCEDNENASKVCLKRIHNFTHDKFDIAIKWKTKKVRQLFSLKDKTNIQHAKFMKVIAFVLKDILARRKEMF